MSFIFKPICVICGEQAATTAAHIPVCQKHWDEYDAEAKQYLTHRPVFSAIQAAAAAIGTFHTTSAHGEVTIDTWEIHRKTP